MRWLASPIGLAARSAGRSYREAWTETAVTGGDEGRRHIRFAAEEVLVVNPAGAKKSVPVPAALAVGESMEQAELVEGGVLTMRTDGRRHPMSILDLVEARLTHRFARCRQEESKIPARHPGPRIARQNLEPIVGHLATDPARQTAGVEGVDLGNPGLSRLGPGECPHRTRGQRSDHSESCHHHSSFGRGHELGSSVSTALSQVRICRSPSTSSAGTSQALQTM